MDIGAYHVLELQIASNPADTRRVMPVIGAEHRRILDVGCGAGQTLVASRLDAQVTAIGIDHDFGALKLGRHIDGRVSFICARGESLPLATGFFDLVVSRVALPYMNTRAALTEMTRVLGPGGSVWLALHPYERIKGELKESLRRLDLRAALHRLYIIANGALLHLTGREFAAPIKHRYGSFQTEQGIRRLMESLGYEDIRIERKGFFVVTAKKPRP